MYEGHTVGGSHCRRVTLYAGHTVRGSDYAGHTVHGSHCTRMRLYVGQIGQIAQGSNSTWDKLYMSRT